MKKSNKRVDPEQWASDMAHDSFCSAMDQLEKDSCDSLTQIQKDELNDIYSCNLMFESFSILESLEFICKLEGLVKEIVPNKLDGFRFIPDYDNHNLEIIFSLIDDNGILKDIHTYITHEVAEFEDLH